MKSIATFAAFICLSAPIWAQMPPITDIDLRAAYCLGVNQSAIQSVGQSSLLQDNISRLKSYVWPKVLADENAIFAISPAMQRGTLDLASVFSDPARQQCYSQCEVITSKLSAGTACLASCSDVSSDAPRLARVRACYNLSWLPF